MTYQENSDSLLEMRMIGEGWVKEGDGVALVSCGLQQQPPVLQSLVSTNTTTATAAFCYFIIDNIVICQQNGHWILSWHSQQFVLLFYELFH